MIAGTVVGTIIATIITLHMTKMSKISTEAEPIIDAVLAGVIPDIEDVIPGI
ncbi:MAG: hypothetical protein ABI407_02705 [Bradyrhizobium sp.]